MRPAVVTAFLLLVGVLNTVTARYGGLWLCNNYYKDKPCGDGWSRFEPNRCAKYFHSPKTFNDAQEQCHTLNADLASIHNYAETIRILCITLRANSEIQPFWIGAKRSGGTFGYTDGSEFNYHGWYYGQPNNAGGNEDCVELNYKGWGFWNDALCSRERKFVCTKKM